MSSSHHCIKESLLSDMASEQIPEEQSWENLYQNLC